MVAFPNFQVKFASKVFFICTLHIKQ